MRMDPLHTSSSAISEISRHFWRREEGRREWERVLGLHIIVCCL
jgi:hypothetical protein